MTPARSIRQIKPLPKGTHTIITITLLLNDEERVFEINPTKLPLIFLEALDELKEDGSWRNMRLGIQKLLKLTDDEAMELETDHIVQIAQAVSGATDIPKG